MRIQINDDLVPLIARKAKEENVKLVDMTNILLKRVLWAEPEYLFKGKNYKVEPEIFNRVVPLENEVEV